jgi:dipeptidyl aminopeptidase/acylaminoacyl peptidase
MTFGTGRSPGIHVLFYGPLGESGDGTRISGPQASAPPVIVQCHGGPTSCADPGFDPVVQFWTTRGFAVAAVDYRGSSGYGREYRSSLDGQWGIADAEDCLAALDFLQERGLVDGGRALARGSSSGGLTALRALSLGRSFAGALVSYGVTDLRSLARETHKFESGYLEGLVGSWPRDADRYEARSPVCAPEAIVGAVLLLQGDQDAVVPPDQADAMARTLRARGMRCEHVLFAGEGHGFRRAETISRAAQIELEFAIEVLGIASGAGAGTRV